YKLMEYQSPIWGDGIPFLFNIRDSHIDCFLGGNVIGELNFSFNVFSYTAVKIFDDVGSVDDFSDLQREVKIISKIVPVVTPGGDGMLVFVAPFSVQVFQGMFSSFFINSGINGSEISAERFTIFP